MDHLRDLADERLLGGCVYCGGASETRDHVPSRVLLDPPFPENLAVVPACLSCNNGFARDEEYLACLIECALAGSTEPSKLRHPRIAAILTRSPALRARLDAASSIVGGQFILAAEEERVDRVVRKLAAGHAAFDLSQTVRSQPTLAMWWPLSWMTAEQRENFDAPDLIHTMGEVGSRATQRMQAVQIHLHSPQGDESSIGIVMNDWVEVQEHRYRYQAVDDIVGPSVRLVIGEFLAAEVRWGPQVSDKR